MQRPYQNCDNSFKSQRSFDIPSIVLCNISVDQPYKNASRYALNKISLVKMRPLEWQAGDWLRFKYKIFIFIRHLSADIINDFVLETNEAISSFLLLPFVTG